jgi:hypothetical protein
MSRYGSQTEGGTPGGTPGGTTPGTLVPLQSQVLRVSTLFHLFQIFLKNLTAWIALRLCGMATLRLFVFADFAAFALKPAKTPAVSRENPEIVGHFKDFNPRSQKGPPFRLSCAEN